MSNFTKPPAKSLNYFIGIQNPEFDTRRLVRDITLQYHRKRENVHYAYMQPLIWPDELKVSGHFEVEKKKCNPETRSHQVSVSQVYTWLGISYNPRAQTQAE